MVFLRERFLATSNGSTAGRLLSLALVSRIVLLVAMAVACAFIPDHSPGDDVVRFALRVVPTSTASTTSTPACFALAGTYCDCGDACTWEDVTGDCAVAATEKANNFLQSVFYPAILEPLTRWDAARFLRLAHLPQLYQPFAADEAGETGCDDEDEQDMPQTCQSQADPYKTAEQAHVFFPLFPVAVQGVADILLLLPPAVLPATCEGTIVLAAWILNTLCFLLAAASLYHLTESILQECTQQDASLWARRVLLLFITNPATVFFGTAYSESIFCAICFTGAALALRSGIVPQVTAVALWLLASVARSNGVLYAGYIVLLVTARILPRRPVWWAAVVAIVTAGGLLYLFMTQVVVAIYNEWVMSNLCEVESPGILPPEWCAKALQRDGTFSVYAHFQKTYWNVGFLRYFEWRQLPNFLLAAPVLILSLAAVISWIRHSWMAYRQREASNNHKGSAISQLVPWAVDTLADFGAPVVDTATTDSGGGGSAPLPTDVLLGGTATLGHYAVLAVAAILGLTMAHVQISTRLIFSSCPAIYFYMAVLIADDEQQPEKSKAASSHSSSSNQTHWKAEAILAYCLLYIVLGVIMHSNWLPWT